LVYIHQRLNLPPKNLNDINYLKLTMLGGRLFQTLMIRSLKNLYTFCVTHFSFFSSVTIILEFTHDAHMHLHASLLNLLSADSFCPGINNIKFMRIIIHTLAIPETAYIRWFGTTPAAPNSIVPQRVPVYTYLQGENFSRHVCTGCRDK